MDEAPAKTTRRRWPRRVAIGGVIATAVFAVLGFFVVPPVAKSIAQKQLGELLGRKVEIDRIRVNPFALSLTIEGFRVLEADGRTPFVGFGRLYVNAELSSVFRRAPVIKEVSLESLRVHVVREKATSEAWADVAAAYNFSDIVGRLAARPKTPEPPEPSDAPPPRFSLNNLRLVDGAVIFDDLPLHGHHEVTDLSIGVPFVSTLPVYLDSFVEPGLSVRIDGTPFSVGGRTKPFGSSLETVLELRLQALDLTKYVPFVPLVLPFVVDGAKLSLALDVAFSRPVSGAPRLTVMGNVALDGLDVRQKHESGLRPLLRLEKLAVDIGESDVGAQRFVIDKVLVAGLDLHVQRLRDGTLNLQHMAPEAPPVDEATRKREREEHRAEERQEHEEREVAKKEREKEPHKRVAKAEGPRFSVGSFVLARAVIHFRDEATTPNFETEVRDFDVDVKGLSNAPGVTATTSIGLRAIPGARIIEHGTLRLTPLEAKGHVAIEDVEPARFAPYYHDAIAFDVSSGRVKVGAEYRVEDEHDKTSVRLSEALVDITDLGLRRRGAHSDFFHLGGLAVHDGKVDLDARTIAIPSISTHEGKLRIVRDEKGVVDLTTLVSPSPPASKATTKVATKPVASSSAAPTAASPSWTVTVDRFDLDKWGARLDDRAVTPRATLTVDPIALHVTNLSTAPGAKAGLDLRLGINKAGRLQITGPASFQPVAANVHFDLRTLEILPLQPYFHDQESLTVTDGTVSLKGQAAIKIPATGDPQLNITTDIDIADVSTVDRAKREPLVDWKSFHVGGLAVSSPPLAIAVDDVSLTDFDARLILFPNAHLNLQDAFAAPGATPPPPAARGAAKAPGKSPTAAVAEPPAAPGPDVKVGQVTLQGGDVTFSDRSIHPGYTAELTELAGRVSGLSSKPGTTADVDIRGSVNRSGALAIVGRVNPLAKDLFADVQVTLRDFDLPPASPYTGKYAGYAIGKGKLDLSLDYKIAGGKLDAKNRLVLDQFTFGDKVASPDAVKLPVRLAIALLKDRRGVIDINLPIAGSLADPEFKIWHAVLKVLGNLVVKAVTAPFSLIASAFGGGDELSRIDFPAGLASLDATAKKRLGALTKAMQERPGISFELEGDADPGKDRDSLRRYLYERKLKKAKMAELVQGGVVVASADDLTIDPAERDALLAKAYAVAKFPKPTNALGLEKSLPPPEQEKLMLSNTRVEDDQLTDLALRRATAVQNALSKSTANGASRLFLVTPRLGSAGGHVELTLKKD